ncbi:MarR family winged helix-turn-helix transcriptional regulator [Pseudonocardia pini]|uniref:MarR family winged helix-turn-helix transcriptional regulator n=1 Tax=Pseudonocardia pini TaxID=2758030 RepID=UPI0015F0D6DE|nr:MarR family transcriptional regulator [Pseudonocardia pini]
MNLSEMRRLGRTLSSAALQAMQGAGDGTASATELAVLDCVRVQDGLTVGEIARRSGFAQGRVSTVVADLVDQGLLAVREDPADRRRSLVTSTARMRELAAQAPPMDAAPVLRELLREAPPERAEEIIAVLEELAEIVEPLAAAYRAGTGGLR